MALPALTCALPSQRKNERGGCASAFELCFGPPPASLCPRLTKKPRAPALHLAKLWYPSLLNFDQQASGRCSQREDQVRRTVGLCGRPAPQWPLKAELMASFIESVFE